MDPIKPSIFASSQSRAPLRTPTPPPPKNPVAESVSDSDTEPVPSPLYTVVTSLGDSVWQEHGEFYSHQEANHYAGELAFRRMDEGTGTWHKAYNSAQLVRIEICGEGYHLIVCAKFADFDWEEGEAKTDEVWIRFGEGGKMMGVHRSEATARNAVKSGEWVKIEKWSVEA
jgi:hypothetical protein